MLGGCLALMVGAGVTIGAIEARQRCAAAAGYRVSGTGFGTAFLGAYRTVVALAYPLTGPG